MSFLKNLNNAGLDDRRSKAILAFVIMLLAVPALIVVLSNPLVTSPQTSIGSSGTSSQTPENNYNPYISDAIGQVVTSGYSSAVAVDPNMQLTVLVGLQFNNPTILNNYLSNVQNPSSSIYHKYMTKQQFYNTFSPSKATYNKLVNYFTSNGLTVSSYEDRVAIKVVGTVSQFENVFHTQIKKVTMNSKIFYAPVKSLKLNTDASSISAVIGLNNYYKAQILTPINESINLYEKYLANPNYSNNPNFCNSYLGLKDIAQGGTCSNQLLVGSDMQAGYQVNQIFSAKSYPYNETVATILWDGTNTTGSQVAPFYPADLVNYFKNTLPSTEPQPNVCGTYDQAVKQAYICGVPVDGAYAQPDITAKNDTSQSNFESTLDLEMVGSIAPGANAIEVYGPSGWANYLDDCMATILNAPANSPLSHTVAISNSWGIFDEPGPWGAIIDPLWQQYTQEAAALGITVLASTGDSGNINGEIPGSPATVGFDNYGVIAVGGTQTFLTGTPSTNGTGTTGIDNQSVWFGTPSPTDGSQGGISVSYHEPTWQKQSFDANNIIKTAEPQISGRGTPDIAAIGANMNITISYFLYNSTGYATGNRSFRMLPIWGTSVASPLAAGVIADMDHYLGAKEGFIDPLIYQLGQAQIDGLYSSIQPFNDVNDYSYNVLWFAVPGYDLATGWGSINAYNFVQDQSTVKTMTFTETGLPTNGVWSITLDNGATFSSSSSSISFMVENGTHTFTVSNILSAFSNVSSGTFNMAGVNLVTPIAFSSGVGSGKGTNTIDAEDFINNASLINFTFSGLGSYYSDLPIGELFYVLTDTNVNSISLYLSGKGQVAVSIGTNLWQSDILAPITINVNAVGWYNVTFPTVKLQGSVEYYYLNVWTPNQQYNQVSWGFINNTIYNTPTISINDVGSYNLVNLQFPYNYYGLDTNQTGIYTLGFTSSPPAIEGPTTSLSTPISSTTSFSWQIFDSAIGGSQQTYTVYKNGTNIGSGTWSNTNNVTVTSIEMNPGTENYTIYVTDSYGGYAKLTTLVDVTGTPSVSTSTSTVISTSTSTTTTTVVSTNTSTVTIPPSNVTQILTSLKSAPGFELIATLGAITVLGVGIFLRKKNKK